MNANSNDQLLLLYFCGVSNLDMNFGGATE